MLLSVFGKRATPPQRPSLWTLTPRGSAGCLCFRPTSCARLPVSVWAVWTTMGFQRWSKQHRTNLNPPHTPPSEIHTCLWPIASEQGAETSSDMKVILLSEALCVSEEALFRECTLCRMRELKLEKIYTNKKKNYFSSIFKKMFFKILFYNSK